MSQSEDSMVPQIQFRGFEEQWRQVKLGEVANLINGRAYSQDELLKSGFYKVLRVGNFYTNSSWYFSDMQLAEKYYANNGDLLYTWSASFGPHIWGGEKVIFHYHIWKIDLSERLVKEFALQLLEKDKEKILNNSNGSTMIHITKGGMEVKEFSIPSPEEQTRIGSYFRELDQLIRQHLEKHDKLVALKQAMLQKMFPQAGTLIPEVRFKGFEGVWCKQLLQHLANRYDNLRVPVSASNRISGNTPYYGANGIQGYVCGYTHDGAFILVAEDGASDLKNYPVQFVNGKIWVNNHAHVLQAKEEVSDNLFLKYAFAQYNVEPFLVGGGRAKLNAEVMMQMEFMVPVEIAEQQKIGQYFYKLDTLIARHATQLARFKQVKAACLEKMFI